MSIQPIYPAAEKGPVAIIAGPWPSYATFKSLPERERWVLYGSAKAYLEALENQGFTMTETYDDFIRRVCREMNL